MNILDALHLEHSFMNDVFDHLEQVVCAQGSLDVLRGAAMVVRRTLEMHARAEEDILLPAFNTRGLGSGPLPLVRHDHKELDAAFGRLLAARNHPEALSICVTLLEDLRSHFAREEESLFPLARTMMSAETLDELGARWAVMRQLSTHHG